ncbi:MAG: hypothetical protein ACXACG_09900 [Candidatus Thorarchaeota archaeon]
MKNKPELALLGLSLVCLPIVIIDKWDMYFEGFDTHWLFIWGTYSDRFRAFFPIPYSSTPLYDFAELTSWFLVFLWIGVTIISYFILQRGTHTTFARDSGLLVALLVVQILAPLILFILAMQGTSYGIIWILPIPGPSLLAIVFRVLYKLRPGNRGLSTRVMDD